MRAIRAVHAGEAVFGSGVAARILQQLIEPAAAQRAFPRLTGREYEALDLLAAGLPTGVIAGRLGVANKTVSNLISSVLVKLQVTDRANAVAQARDAGLGRGSDNR